MKSLLQAVLIIGAFSSAGLAAFEYSIDILPSSYLLAEASHGVIVHTGLSPQSTGAPQNNSQNSSSEALGLADPQPFESTGLLPASSLLSNADVYANAELFLSFEEDTEEELLGYPYTLAAHTGGASQAAASARIHSARAYRGKSAALLTNGNAIRLQAGQTSMFAPNALWGDFSIEFWLYPAKIDSHTRLLSWSAPSLQEGELVEQALSISARQGRLIWSIENIFVRLHQHQQEEENTLNTAVNSAAVLNYRSLSLQSRTQIVPRRWSQHMLRYDSERGFIEYLIDGRSEDSLYITDNGQEAGNAFLPLIGNISPAPIVIGENINGFLDDFVIHRKWVQNPQLGRRATQAGYAVMGPIFIGRDRLSQVSAQLRQYGQSEVIFSALRLDSLLPSSAQAMLQGSPERIHTSAYFKQYINQLPWQEILPNTPLDSAEFSSGNFLYLRVDFLPDPYTERGSILQNLSLRVEEVPSIPAPSGIVARALPLADSNANADSTPELLGTASSNANPRASTTPPTPAAIQISWNPVLGAEGYLLYYGRSPNRYTGNDSPNSASPIDIGNSTNFTLQNLPPGTLYYFRLASYNSANSPERGLYLERQLSPEFSTRSDYSLQW